uniref:Mitochondrial import receptor subunit TOM70 (inferred by orthology to a human protein) n=1 Tax=Strongyloides venezuelensis TaxID=75913 RepID=A0A0K0F5G5_STRVS
MENSQINVPTWSKYLCAAIVSGAVIYVGGRLFLWSNDDNKNNKKVDISKYGKISENGKKAAQLKADGNEFFKNKDYTNAVKTYLEAISLCDETLDHSLLAELHQNAAASYNYLGDHEKEIEHCTISLKFSPGFIKALKRRAAAYEKTRSVKNAGDDYLLLASLEPKQAAMYQDKAVEAYKLAATIVADYKFKKLPEEARPIVHQQMFAYLFHTSIHNPLALYVRRKKDCSVLAEEPEVQEVVQLLRDHKFDEAFEICEKYISQFNFDTKKIEFYYLVEILYLKCLIVQRRYTLARSVYEEIENRYNNETIEIDEKYLNDFMLTWKILGMELSFRLGNDEGEDFFNNKMGQYKENTDSYLNHGIFKISTSMTELASSAEKAYSLDNNNIYAMWYQYYGQCINSLMTGDYSCFIKKAHELENKLKGYGYTEDSYIGWFFLSQVVAMDNYKESSRILKECSKIYPKNVFNKIIDISTAASSEDASSPESYLMYMLKVKKVIEDVFEVDKYNSAAFKLKARILMEESKAEEAMECLDEALKYASTIDEYADVILDSYLFKGSMNISQRRTPLVK